MGARLLVLLAALAFGLTACSADWFGNDADQEDQPTSSTASEDQSAGTTTTEAQANLPTPCTFGIDGEFRELEGVAIPLNTPQPLRIVTLNDRGHELDVYENPRRFVSFNPGVYGVKVYGAESVVILLYLDGEESESLVCGRSA